MNKPARKVVKPAPPRTVRLLNLRGVLPRPVEAESKLEADFVRQAALSRVVRAITAQAFRLPVSPKGYVPDFLLDTLHDQPMVVEVKLDGKVDEYRRLFDRAAACLAERRMTFAVATEKTIRNVRLHERAALILRYAKAVYPIVDKDSVVDCVGSTKQGLPMGALLKKTKLTRHLILHLIAHKALTTGSRLSLDDSAVVSLPVIHTEMSDEIQLARWLGVAPWPKNA